MKNNSALILLFSGLLAFFGPVSCGYAAWEQKASYGTRVKYQAGQKIEFPDFTVEYVGERRKSLPVYPRGFLYYDFKVRTANIEKVVSWSSGTGDIGPVRDRQQTVSSRVTPLRQTREIKQGQAGDQASFSRTSSRRSSQVPTELAQSAKATKSAEHTPRTLVDDPTPAPHDAKPKGPGYFGWA